MSARAYIKNIDIPTYGLEPRSVLPPLFDPAESMYPYTGYRATSPQPVKRTYQAVIIENDILRVTVLPELGGRILNIEDIRTGETYIHLNDAVRAVRIPPRWAFLSLGIELNFPSTHSPTGTEPVGFSLLEDAYGGAGVAVGEQDLRLGLHWRAEIKLYPGFRGVCVAVKAWNPTSTIRDVQWWSNCAQPAGGDTEFVYPDEPVLAHLIGEQNGHWPVVAGRDLRWHGDYDQMCGMFWEPTKEDWFGVYHHERGWGLLHLSDPAHLPGKKLWSFGHTGATADWTLAMTRSGDRTCEIQAGVPTLQKDFVRLHPDQEMSFVEFWVPVDSRNELDSPKRPSFTDIVDQLGGLENLEAKREGLHSPSGDFWKQAMHAEYSADIAFFYRTLDQLSDIWPPTGLPLESALRWGAKTAGEKWKYQLALWCCATEQWQDAYDNLVSVIAEFPDFAQAHVMLGLLLWKTYNKPRDAWVHIEKALSMLPDGQLLVHANSLLRKMNMLEARRKLLDIWNKDDFRRRETEAELALDSGNPETAIRILIEAKWERHHCRHRRGELWQAARIKLGLHPGPVPAILGEDPVQVDEGHVTS